MPAMVAFSSNGRFEEFLLLIIQDKLRVSKSKKFSAPFQNDVLLFSGDAPFNYSQKPILVLNNGKEMISNFPSSGLVITDFSKSRNIKGNWTVNSVGFTNSSSLWLSDNSENSFKINYGGDSVPFWTNHSFSQEELIDLLLAIRVSMILGLNLVEISQGLDNL